MIKAKIKHDKKDAYWLIVEHSENSDIKIPILLSEIETIRDACNDFLKRRDSTF